MLGFKEVFQNRHAILPVVHVQTPEQALANAEIAKEEGCDGVFLISMEQRATHQELLEVHRTVREGFGTWFLGINYLDLPSVRVFENLDSGVSGVWTDNAHIEEWLDEQIEAEEIKRAREVSKWNGLYFGGVAFKYQRYVNAGDLALSAVLATKYMDVVTTSGIGTGKAANPEKISIMKAAIGDHPLGIASGVSPDNVSQYIGHADAFLVASSLLIPNTENFDKSRVRDLVAAVRGN
ncbi:MAG: hypothetical protein ACD_37C00611G0002 [uncultured bacterium]|nr:MAG: hypothetical protein ACD_37C00611G0002 [uncultured bacterium]